MKLIIAGSRHLNVTIKDIEEYIKRYNLQPSVILTGHAQGIDKCGEEYAWFKGLSVHGFPADWGKYGKSAGPKRNKQMAEAADVLLLIWDGQSRGSANMRQNMYDLNKKIYEIIIIPE